MGKEQCLEGTSSKQTTWIQNGTRDKKPWKNLWENKTEYAEIVRMQNRGSEHKQWSEEGLAKQTYEDLKYLSELDETKFLCFSIACTAKQSRNNILLSVLNRVYTVTSLDL